MTDELQRQIRLIREVLDPNVRLLNHQGLWRPVRMATLEERRRWATMPGGFPG